MLFKWQEIPFTHLILCTGTHGPFPGSTTAEPSYRTAIQKYDDLVKEVSLVVAQYAGTCEI